MARGRILAVDDQPYFRDLFESLLGEEGYEVQTAASGEEALHLFEHGVFDLIVTDLVMPVMTGTDLVFRVKQLDPEQQIMVVTGVVDVRSAVEAMKVGATDYLLKPFERSQLCAAVDAIFQRASLRADHDRLLAENLEFLSERALLGRALELMGAPSHAALADKLLGALCEETGAQSGVLWRADADGGAGFRLAAARGLVRAEEEPLRLGEADLPGVLRRGAGTALAAADDAPGGPGACLWVALRDAGATVAVARLGDKLGGDRFDEADTAGAAKLANHAATAYRQVERVAQLERRSLQDPDTGAYHVEALQDVARNEIEKANRFGRRFGLLQVSVEPVDALRRGLGEEAFRSWHGKLVRYLGRFLRSTDLLAVQGEGRLCVMLAETDAVGAATFKQRLREALLRGEPLAGLPEGAAPGLALGVVTYPGDATQLDSLLRTLDQRTEADRQWRVKEERLARLDLAAALGELLERAEEEDGRCAASLLRFLLAERGRRPRERNLLFARPGPVFDAALHEGLARRCDPAAPGEIAVVGEAGGPGLPAEGVTWISPETLADAPPFAVQFGDGPPYVWVAEPKGEGGSVRLFHSGDRALAESLAFRLQRELQVSVDEGAGW